MGRRVDATLNWISSERVLPRILRLASISGVLWGLLQVLQQFNVSPLPNNGVGLRFFALIVSCIYLLGELIVLIHTRPLADPTKPGPTPGEAFAQGLLRYAHSLSSEGQYKDQAILELRS